MHCPNCQAAYTSAIGNKCPQCNVDTVLYMGIVRLSDRLYNTGLERLKNADFTYGIESLEKSVNVNKNNVPARNLLGLALFEVGHVGEALKHWVISTSLLKEDNPAQGYIDKVHKNARGLEKLNDSIGMYNVALGHINQKSDDLAIIQLKKAVDTNPRFVDALNLLALCYLIQSDKDRAAAVVERVLVLDVQNPTALNYYTVLHPGRTRPSLKSAATPRRQVQANVGAYSSIGMQDKKSTNFNFAAILSFIIGVVISAAFIYFLIIPAFQSEHDADALRLMQQMEANETAHEAEVQAVQGEVEELHQRINDLNSTIISMAADASLQDRQLRVHHAHMLYSNDQLQEAIDSLESIETTGLPPDIRERMDEIRENAYPRLGLINYNTGLAAFNANPRDTYLALNALEAAFRFMNEDATQWNDLNFMLGTLYYDDGRLSQAEELLSYVRERAPNFRPITITNMLNSIETQTE